MKYTGYWKFVYYKCCRTTVHEKLKGANDLKQWDNENYPFFISREVARSKSLTNNFVRKVSLDYLLYNIFSLFKVTFHSNSDLFKTSPT